MYHLLRIAGVVFALGLSTAAQAAGDPAQGKSKSTACQACHGAEGISSNPQYPSLAGQHANYIVRALKDYQNGSRKNPIMSGMAAPLSKQDQLDIAAYFSSLKGLYTLHH